MAKMLRLPAGILPITVGAATRPISFIRGMSFIGSPAQAAVGSSEQDGQARVKHVSVTRELLGFFAYDCNRRNPMLPVGSAAPDFSVTDHEGQSVSLSSMRGKWLALWWYPKASTRG